MPVHPDIDGIISHLKTNLASVGAIAEGLSTQQFNWRVEPGRWSIGQCITHLNMIDGADLARLEAVIDAARSQSITANGPFRYSWLSRKFVNSMEPPITRKFSAPKPYLPPPEVAIDATVNEFRRISNELLRLAEKARGLDLRKVKTGLSGVPLIKMSLGARLSLLATHDTRHLWQADQVRHDARFPK